MADKSMYLGAGLVAFGVLVTILSDSGSVTSLIPAFFGIVFFVLGWLARARPESGHHFMHGASLLALVGVLAGVGALVGRGASGWALLSQIVLIVSTAVFLVLAIRSFREARRAREAAPAD